MWDVLDEVSCGVGVGVRSGASLHFYLGLGEGSWSGVKGTSVDVKALATGYDVEHLYRFYYHVLDDEH